MFQAYFQKYHKKCTYKIEKEKEEITQKRENMCIFNKYDFADSVRYTVEIALTDLKLAPALIEATGNKTDKVVQKE